MGSPHWATVSHVRHRLIDRVAAGLKGAEGATPVLRRAQISITPSRGRAVWEMLDRSESGRKLMWQMDNITAVVSFVLFWWENTFESVA